MDFVEEGFGMNYKVIGIQMEVAVGKVLDSILAEVGVVLDKDHLHRVLDLGKVLGLGKVPVLG
jgi:hypothetical protein